MSLSRVGLFIKNVFKNITVEPIVFLYILTFSTYSIVFQNLQIEKACKINLNQTADICDNLNDLGNEQVQNEVLLDHRFPRYEVGTSNGITIYNTCVEACSLA